MIDWDKPIETLDGLVAKVISRDFRNRGFGKCVLVQIEDLHHSYTASYYQDGIAVALGPELRNRKTKREGWINIYRDDRTGETIYKTKDDAEGSSIFKIATIKIEWEELR